jgi:hypothetical protein
MSHDAVVETEMSVGPLSIEAYSRLSYSMWHALAEFIDNSTQSRTNYGAIIDEVLQHEGTPLVVEIEHNRLRKEIEIRDNSIGMTKEKLIEALKIAHPTKDSKGRSKYGMGMKTAACWIGRKWKIVTCEWLSGQEWTAVIDVESIARRGGKIPLTMREVDTDKHYTHVLIENLHRNIQKRTEETIKGYLGSMYRHDLQEDRLKLLYNGEEVKHPADYEIDTDPEGNLMRRDLPATVINGKTVRGWVGVLKKGGRKFGGFSLFQEKRQIQGFPTAWKPKSIFGGVDDEGANNLVVQRLFGFIQLDGFNVSHTKDAILFEGDEEDDIEKLLYEATKDYRDYAIKRRNQKGQAWSKDKIRDFCESMKKEFSNEEMGDALNGAMLPPLETIQKNNQTQLASVTEDDEIATIDVTPELRVVVSMQERSEYDPHLTIVAGAVAGTIHVIINGQHPYYSSIESADAVEECIRQYIYDAISEYKVSKLTAKVAPESIRRLKDSLLRVQVVRIENAAQAIQDGEYQTIIGNGS